MNNEYCPVCGYKDITVLDEHGCTTFEICNSCGCESGYNYDANSSDEHLENTRIEWFIKNRAKWWSTTTKQPENWNPIKQMEEARIKVPK